ncbi:MAG TPA: hypothetical protein VLJ83_07540 [Gemmatimonadaceae bacterium]|nr:hypothetical protein [Gemmatimonadaceae bacterium]
MTNTDRLRLVFHGAIVVLIGLLAGLPTTVEVINGSERFWHTAHEALIMIGIFLLAASSVVPALVLERRERSFLIWSFITMGYGFVVALIIGGVAGANAFEPGDSPAKFTAFVAAIVGIAAAFLATGLTLMGARAALRRATNGSEGPGVSGSGD